MAFSGTVVVPHLGGIRASYHISISKIDSTKPTILLICAVATSAHFYARQFQNIRLTALANLIAIEPLGHGDTQILKQAPEIFNFWDTAIMNWQVLDKLGVKNVFICGCSQGGWIAARMAISSPDRVKGMIFLSTTMDSESGRSRELALGPVVDQLLPNSIANPEFVVPGALWEMILMGVGSYIPDYWPDFAKFWEVEVNRIYNGDEGRRKLRTTYMNILERDGLHDRLHLVKCPVVWFQGTSEGIFSIDNAKEELKYFTNSPKAELKVIEGGPHYLNISHSAEIDEEIIRLVKSAYGED